MFVLTNSSKIVLLNDVKMHHPLHMALQAQGVVFLSSAWDITESLLRNASACFDCFYNCLRHPVRLFMLQRKLRHYKVPLIAWNRDAPHYLNRSPWRLDWLDRARLLDIYATHTLIDTRRFAEQVLYLPNAADTENYHLHGPEEAVFARLRDPAAYRYDVSFFGGMDGKRYKEDAEREQFFGALGERLKARGLRVLFREAAGMSVAEQVELIQTSRINLNFGARCEYGAPVASGLPERCFGIPACGGFLLCDRRTHARDDFSVGKNWAEFTDLEDCIAQIDYWLTHFDEARALAEHCHRHVTTHHTYSQRAASLLAALFAWHASRK